MKKPNNGSAKASKLLKKVTHKPDRMTRPYNPYQSHNPPPQITMPEPLKEYLFHVPPDISAEARRIERELVKKLITPQDIAIALRAFANDHKSSDLELAGWAEFIAHKIDPN
jgi:hypothetical protein